MKTDFDIIRSLKSPHNVCLSEGKDISYEIIYKITKEIENSALKPIARIINFINEEKSRYTNKF